LKDLSFLKYPEKVIFISEKHHIDENVSINCAIVCASRSYVNAAFGVRVALYSPQHNEVYKINEFYAEMFVFLLLMVT